MKLLKKISLVLLAAFGTMACDAEAPGKKRPSIVCTTGMISDAVVHLVGDSLEVITLMGPGVDPHLYKATQGDIEALTKADVVVYNGLHLEGKMGEIFEKLTSSKAVISMGDQVPRTSLINNSEFQGGEDPHIWFDVSIWIQAINGLSEQLQIRYPNMAEFIAKNQEAYVIQLKDLHQSVKKSISSIPQDQRVIITAHDAFKYFGKAYGVKVRGLQGISTAAEYGLRDVSDLVNYITEKRIKAIFVESSVPTKSIEAVIEGCKENGHEVQLGGELFSDALGAAGTAEGTYIGMVEHNVKVITEALR